MSLDAAAEDEQVALDRVQFRHAGQMPPGLETETPEQRKARLVVAEDEREQPISNSAARSIARATSFCA